jgi:hypothetical protein
MNDINIERFKSLPKVEVSFQDDFNEDVRNYTITPKYVLRKLHEVGFNPKIGDEILLWEKTSNMDGSEYYICNVGKIATAKNNQKILAIVKNMEDMAQIDREPIFMEMDLKEVFQLPGESPVFK